MQDFDIEKKNILMKFRLIDETINAESIIFVYSNTKGLEHLNKVLENNPLFSNMLTPEEILTKMSYEMAWQFPYNSFTGIASTKWSGKSLMIMEKDKETFEETFKVWKNQMEQFVGKDNLFQVHMPEKELKRYEDFIKENKITDQDEGFIEFVENYRLGLMLDEELSINKGPKSKNKL